MTCLTRTHFEPFTDPPEMIQEAGYNSDPAMRALVSWAFNIAFSSALFERAHTLTSQTHTSSLPTALSQTKAVK